MIPSFTSAEQAKEYLIKSFREVINKIEGAKTHGEKVKVIKEWDMTQYSAEDQPLENKPVKDYPEYQKAKTLVYDFFNWVESQKGVNIIKATHEDPFFNEMSGNKTLMIAELIQMLPYLPVELQAYFVLNIFRTTYELNFKNLTLILNEYLKRQNKKTSDFYYMDDFKTEFADYTKMNDLLEYFKNDIRNPVAHENWFIKNEWVWTKNKRIEKKEDMLEISKQIYELFYFRVALSTFMLEGYRKHTKDKSMSTEQVSKFVEGIKQKIQEIENE
jgi:hypothetical protein